MSHTEYSTVMYSPVFEKFFQMSPKSSATAKDPELSSSSTAYSVVLPLWGKNPGLWQVNMESFTDHSPFRPDTMPVAQAWRGILSFNRHDVGPLVVHDIHLGIFEHACAQSEGFIILEWGRKYELILTLFLKTMVPFIVILVRGQHW